MKGADGYSDSDEDQHDAYLERMKQEGKIREEGDGSDESEGDSGNDTPQLKHKLQTLFFSKFKCEKKSACDPQEVKLNVMSILFFY